MWFDPFLIPGVLGCFLFTIYQFGLSTNYSNSQNLLLGSRHLNVYTLLIPSEIQRLIANRNFNRFTPWHGTWDIYTKLPKFKGVMYLFPNPAAGGGATGASENRWGWAIMGRGVFGQWMLSSRNRHVTKKRPQYRYAYFNVCIMSL